MNHPYANFGCDKFVSLYWSSEVGIVSWYVAMGDVVLVEGDMPVIVAARGCACESPLCA